MLSAETGAEESLLYDYGVGIDTYKDVIKICVLVKQENTIKYYESEHQPSRENLVNAGDWVRNVIREKSKAAIEPEPLRYAIESKSPYRLLVIEVLSGEPTIITPWLAGPLPRINDISDARC